MIVFLAVAALLVAAIALFMNRPEFGRAPRGERLERIRRSPNYRDGAFRNRHATPQLTSGKGWWATNQLYTLSCCILVFYSQIIFDR